jgi:hypothetical protein
MNCDFCSEPLTNGRHPLMESGAYDVTDCQIMYLLRKTTKYRQALEEIAQNHDGHATFSGTQCAEIAKAALGK